MNTLKTLSTLSSGKIHVNCRGKYYPRTDSKIERVQVPDDKVDWSVPFPDYTPTSYTSPHILAAPPYADPKIGSSGFKPVWNALDGKINRSSHEGPYTILDGFPRNLHGRTGVTGRGALGRWGPNHAADPIVTRWKIINKKRVHDEKTGRPILQFVCIQRRDCGAWAIPGGMVDPGERVSVTLQREFQEEALNSLEMTPQQKKQTEQQLKFLFSGGEEVYSGYVDDPRSTDNAWIETVAYNFHENDQNGILYHLHLHSGDDAQAVTWKDICGEMNLYATHKDIIKEVAVKHQAHW
ncbi:hypothetical protein Pcinc_011563 [Petrolisthes cinctipes]|uniref:Nudix hydrolase domain-containing protein n=1 Tax=Petrolisthes cinctipes TaxID=88211 RepID=A0AAE1G6L8_PETCI|nr:hypothetical protein Pcinc_011563 [Petrolisthes cinctipes]